MTNTSETTADLISKASSAAACWEESPYYEDAERWMHVFWGAETDFFTMFKRLDLAYTLELACGHGRHGEHIITHYNDRIRRLTMMDILQSNIDYCTKRIASDKVALIKNDGTRFNGIADEACTSVFCYDAMVHFDKEVVGAYLFETYRALRVGGMGLFHHSNHWQSGETHFSKNPHARAYMSAELFAEYARDVGLRVSEQKVIDWGHEPGLDCLTLAEKPAH